MRRKPALQPDLLNAIVKNKGNFLLVFLLQKSLAEKFPTIPLSFCLHWSGGLLSRGLGLEVLCMHISLNPKHR